MNRKPSSRIGAAVLLLGVLLLGGKVLADWTDEARVTGERGAPCTMSGSMFARLRPERIPEDEEEFAAMQRCGELEEERPQEGTPEYAELEACKADDMLPPLSVLRATRLYDAYVGAVIQAHMQLHTQKTDSCKENPPFSPATGALRALAAELPPWKSEMRVLTLTEQQMTGVLLEYMRVYKCSLFEYAEAAQSPAVVWWFAADHLTDEPGEEYVDDITAYATSAPLAINRLVNREIATAEEAMERTIAFVGGIDRLHAGDVDFECVRRASLDLRNVLGLLSEALSCAARSLDAKSSLRDPPPIE